jgi:hypothetical protein
MKSVLFSVVVLASVSSFAFGRESGGLGPIQQYAHCVGKVNGVAATFDVNSTAVVGLAQGVLVEKRSGVVIASLYCKPGADIVAGVPSAGQIVWDCSYDGHVDDGDMSVKLERGGVTGVVTGVVTQKQMYPLKPKKIGQLVCNLGE